MARDHTLLAELENNLSVANVFSGGRTTESPLRIVSVPAPRRVSMPVPAPDDGFLPALAAFLSFQPLTTFGR